MRFREIRQQLEEGELSCLRLVNTCLEKINEASELNAFISVFASRARRRAQAVDEKIARGQAGQLAGMLVAVKDNIAVKHERLTCASRILSDYISPYDATVVSRLEAEDAILIGKTNMDEFAMGSSNENSFFGPARNPHDLSRVAGGSSGGSCVAVAAEMCTVALGSDTGGSIRQPAAFCGVVGLKPTYGRVSRYGLVAFASSFDQVGPIADTVEDAALVLQVISGFDEHDATSAAVEVPDFSRFLGEEVRGMKIGLPREYLTPGVAPDIRRAVDAALSVLQQAGAEVVEVSLPHTDYAIATYYILATAEASSNLARYDGAHYGFRADAVSDLEEMYVKSRSEGFGREVKRRIMLGTYVLSAGYYDAYYRRAQKVRTLIRRDFEHAFTRCDCLLTPTSPTTAFKLGEKVSDPLQMYLSDVFTVSANLAGVPAISVPFGVDAEGLPVGVQIIGKHFDEETLLRVGYHLQKNRKLAESA
ncbi:MAG: Asp-tRNA(Asn)/Glu-tRNA(Gln) amidotransferase subunit GatA [Calditrichaeota bacterium]|nr:MAG: Asp-tRNA(Asn)/Glu-tRNA(Gln) amidotransferase subunit GatA [Calditrichota bacterium]